MLKWFLRRRTAAFERRWNYDAGYIHRIIEADPAAALAFAKVMGIADYRRGVPLAPYSAAAILAVMNEDCGPCTQLAIDKAERGGVAPEILRSLTLRDFDALPEEVALAARFTESTLHHLDTKSLRREIIRRWGETGLISLAYAITSSRLFPTLKYALGHGHACVKLQIGGKEQKVGA